MISAASSGASALFSGSTDLGALTPAATAYSLYTKPTLLRDVQGWDGSTLPASQRGAADSSTSTTTTQRVVDQFSFNPFDQKTWDVNPPAKSSSPFSFNPFDQKSWWADPKGSTVDRSA